MDTQVRSPLTTVRTCGQRGRRHLVRAGIERIAEVVERSVHGPRSAAPAQDRRGPDGRPGAAPRSSPAGRTPREPACPTDQAVHQRVILGKSSSRRSSVSSFESRIPSGAVTPIGTTTTPTDTGPAHAPRPTSSSPATVSNPSADSDFSKRALGPRSAHPGRPGRGGFPSRDSALHRTPGPIHANLQAHTEPSWLLITLPIAFRGNWSTTRRRRGRL